MLKRPAQRQPAIRMVYGFLVMLAVFLALTDGYLVYLTAGLLGRSLGSV
jgi:hypothetical protein